MGKLRTFLLEKLPWIVTVLGIICWTYYCHVLVMDADLLTSKNGSPPPIFDLKEVLGVSPNGL